MFPLLAIGGAISAVVSVVQGASWLSNQLDSAKATPAAGGKSDAKPPAAANNTLFEAALAAQAAGQIVPVRGADANAPASSAAIVTQQHGTAYDTLARTQAGIAAYGHIGERHGNHSGAAKSPDGASEVQATRS